MTRGAGYARSVPKCGGDCTPAKCAACVGLTPHRPCGGTFAGGTGQCRSAGHAEEPGADRCGGVVPAHSEQRRGGLREKCRTRARRNLSDSPYLSMRKMCAAGKIALGFCFPSFLFPVLRFGARVPAVFAIGLVFCFCAVPVLIPVIRSAFTPVLVSYLCTGAV